MDNLYESFSKHNKYKLVRNQHIIPIESIKRFSNNFKVKIKNLKSKNKKISYVYAKDSIFTAKRLW